MKVSEIKKILFNPKMQNKNTNLKIIVKRTKRPTISDVMMALEKLEQEVRKGFAQVNARIDNLVIKNNLKE